MRETELKAVVPDETECIRRLREAGASEGSAGRLEDRRYDYPDRRLTRQDVVLRRQTTEVEHFNGEIVRLGAQYGVPTPYNSALLEMMRELLERKAMPGLFTLEQVRARVAQKSSEGVSRHDRS